MTDANAGKGQYTRDRSGARIVAHGELGRYHVVAHRLYDCGDFARGREILGAFLERARGSGSLWVHLQFHMMVFELATGDADSARRRFEHEIAPAISGGDAPCDAPAAIWHLRLAGVEVDSDDVRAAGVVARGDLHHNCRPVVQLHHILALGACGDVDGLGGWVLRHTLIDSCLGGCSHCRIALGLMAHLRGDRASARHWLEAGIELLSSVGASGVQNEIFAAILRSIRGDDSGESAANARGSQGLRLVA